MPKKILSVLLGLLTFAVSNSAALAQEIPAGYALVPISALTGQSFGSFGSSAATVSAASSALRAGDEIGYLGEAFQVVATLRDENNQPISGKSVNLISSRNTDAIRAIQATTDENGEAIFSVNAAKEGISSFTAIDQSSGVAVNERPRIVFLKPANGIGGDYLRSEVLAANTTAAYQGKVVADFPASVAVNTPSDITVKITDLSGNTVENFGDSVSFTSTNTDAILPRDYTFKEVDRGTHTFANAVTFRSAGLKSFTINSTNAAVAPLIVSVEVMGAVAKVEQPTILSPEDGAVSNKPITLQGLAPANSNLAVFVDSQYAAQGSSDAAGNFDIDVELPDGEHEITAAVLVSAESVGAMSTAIKVTMDTTPPELTQLVLDPGDTVTTEDKISVIIQSEENLSEVSVNINGKDVICSNEGEGFYLANVGVLPAGNYPIAATLTDAAGNSAEFTNAITLKVEDAAAQLTIDPVTATPKNQRVDITWAAPANQAEVNHYAIFYGVDAANLTQVFETTDNRNAWYIGNLNNDTQYTFQIVSLDATGKANGYSNPFAATPTSQLGLIATGCDTKLELTWKLQENEMLAGYRLDYGIKSGEYSETKLLPDGATRNQWEIRDLIKGVEYFITLRGVDAAGNIVFDPQEEISATPTPGACHAAAADQPIQLQIRQDENGKTTLVWNPVSGAIGYKVFAGNTPNFFDLPVVTVNTPYFRPEGLMANEDYYFAVKAIYTDHEAAAFSNLAKVEVGPAAILAIAGIIALIGGYLLNRKEKSLDWIRIRR